MHVFPEKEAQVNEETLHLCLVNKSNVTAIFQCETFKVTGFVTLVVEIQPKHPTFMQ